MGAREGARAGPARHTRAESRVTHLSVQALHLLRVRRLQLLDGCLAASQHPQGFGVGGSECGLGLACLFGAGSLHEWKAGHQQALSRNARRGSLDFTEELGVLLSRGACSFVGAPRPAAW
jgi:hypothetical protein